MYPGIHCSNSSPILEFLDKFASQICHENINKPLDGAYLADFGTDITLWCNLPFGEGELLIVTRKKEPLMRNRAQFSRKYDSIAKL